jgi:hypothetical protein
MKRRNLLRLAASGTGILWGMPNLLLAQNNPPKGDPLPLERVKEFVGAGHNNLDAVKQMLADHPTLLYAMYDWGGGDFETALEGAGHVGNKEIAHYLIGLGARTNLFVLTMLGKTNIVKPFLEEYPEFLHAKGPHGFTLLHHAQRGGAEAGELLDFLTSKGLKETRVKL